MSGSDRRIGEIDRLLREAAELRRRGDYRGAAARARAARRMDGAGDALLCCRVALEAAKGAYGLSRFDECRGAIEEIRSHLDLISGPEHRRIDVEATILLANLLRRRCDYRRALGLLRAAGAHDGDDPPLLVAERLLAEGACLFYLDNEDEAERLLESALGLATHYRHQALRSRILAMLSLLAQNRGLSVLAGDYADRARRICRDLGDRYGEAAAALNLSLVLRRRGQLHEAKRRATEARKGFAAVGWRIGHCRSTIALGMIRRDGGDARGAVRLLRKAERIANVDGYRRELCLARFAIAGIRLDQGMLSDAERLVRSGLETAMRVSPAGDLVAEANRRLGELYLARRAVAPAVIHLKKAMQLARRRRDRLEEALSRRLLARCDLAAGKTARAAGGFNEACEVLRRAGCSLELARTHLLAADGLLAATDERPGEPVDIEMLWSGVLEAVHLLSSADVPDLRSWAGKLLGVLSARRRVAIVATGASHGGDGVIHLQFDDDYCIADGFVAVSEQMNAVWRQIGFAASFDRPVLVTGETGTGKELVARTIHGLGARRARPFVAVNCAAIPEHLFESEFFGHRKGSFTGALTDRTGFFEEAAGGTLFLDEVGELSTLHQVKLLRVLQEKRVRRLGENIERPVDVRIISATNREIEGGDGEPAFREDFYYRINAERIHLPPLRSRPEDVIPLVSWILCGKPGGPRRIRIEAEALKRLQRYGWPGNVRELFAVLDRVRHLVSGGVVTVHMLPPRLAGGQSGPATDPLEMPTGGPRTRESLRKALSRHNGNKTAAARWLGISRGTLYKELRRAGLEHFIRGPRTA